MTCARCQGFCKISCIGPRLIDGRVRLVMTTQQEMEEKSGNLQLIMEFAISKGCVMLQYPSCMGLHLV